MKLMEQAGGTSSPAEKTDEELARQAAEGSRLCFDTLVYRYASRLSRFLATRLPTEQDAEDMAQETFIKAYEHIGSYDPRWRFSTWLYTIGSRLAGNHNRSSRRETGGHLGDSFDNLDFLAGDDTPADEAGRAEDSHNLWASARALKPGQYQALWLRYAEEMPVKDIAAVMKKSQIHVRVLLHRARTKLTGMMASNDGNQGKMKAMALLFF
ncbi:MAG: sigma-70 family RNA polymerase sigma factor [bacterium]|nr:sigma-70 family RNA polymerase sigma factor [bacterium]